mgnify:CR=1 FL=1
MKVKHEIISFDTEDDGEGNPYLWCFVWENGYRSFTRRDRALYFLESFGEKLRRNKRIVECWATNLEYDIINLFGFERIRELDLVFGKSYMVGAKWPERNVIFRDTVRHIPMGVKGLGELVGLKKLEFKHRGQKDTETGD